MTDKKPVIKLPAMLDVRSSSIAQIGYDGEALFVRFMRGSVYRYPGVKPAEFADLRKAESMGKHLQVNILRNYMGSVVPDDEADGA